MIEYYYDTFGRSTGYAINGTRQTTIAYDSFGRIATMSTSTGGGGVPPAQNEGDQHHSTPTPTNYTSFHWAYLQGSDLKQSLTYPNGLTASWTYDANNQLLQVRNATPTNIISQFDYTYDAAGRRTTITRSGTAFGDLSGSIDSYTYNTRSELTSARRTKNGQPIPGFSEDFDYDPIGNRRTSATYNEKGEAQISTYQANNLNQYTQRTTPGYAAVRGEADPNATVTVNENPTFRLGSYYFGSDLFDNTTAGGLANLETYAALEQTAANGEETEDHVSSTTNQVYLAQSSDTFAYDDDGNQTLITTKTGLWRVTYNGENRPILWVRDSDNTTLSMCYDHMGRRREKNDQRFFYDGYLQIYNYHTTTTTPDYNYFLWDPSEPIATRPLVLKRGDTATYYTHDGNKNVSEIVSASSAIVAHYEYAAFGGVNMQCGEDAELNLWRFSSEFFDEETQTVYFNYRHYDPQVGRWLRRDPIGEIHLENPFVFVKNRVVGKVDELGLRDCCKCNECEVKIIQIGEPYVTGYKVVNGIGDETLIFEEKNIEGKILDELLNKMGGKLKGEIEKKADWIMKILGQITDAGQLYQPQVRVGRKVKYKKRECKKKYWLFGDCAWKNWHASSRLCNGAWTGPQGDTDVEKWVAIFMNPDVFDTISKMKNLAKSAVNTAFEDMSEENVKEEIRSYTGCKLIDD